MDRLTKMIDGFAHGAEGVSNEKLTGKYCRGNFESTACVEKLAEYENLEEQRLLVRLPCKTGDWVYVIKNGNIDFHVVVSIEIAEDGVRFISRYPFCKLEDFGKTAFLTESEAMEALKEMENK